MRASLRLLILAITVLILSTRAESQEPTAPDSPSLDRYVLDYPVVDRCCPPIRSTFFEADRTFSVVRGKRFRHKPNGGYGLPVADKADGQHLLHVGADLGWHQVGEPVFAVANGVVRMSMGPEVDRDAASTNATSKTNHRTPRAPANVDLSWGNFVVIEHRFGDDQYFTTIYGHLGPDRLVSIGDVVQAGQLIGEIGRQHPRINGGYTPHLHFGVREGRMAEIGSVLMRLNVDGRPAVVSLAGLDEESIEVRLPDGLEPPIRAQSNGRTLEFLNRDGKTVAPAGILWELQRRDFALVGYALSTDGWRDPIRFLREQRADSNPAPFQFNAARRSR